MAAYYYTITPEVPNVYHTNQSCEEGLKIEPENRRDSDTVPVGRDLCEVC